MIAPNDYLATIKKTEIASMYNHLPFISPYKEHVVQAIEETVSTNAQRSFT
jgi:hypothetical protein